MGKVKLSVRGLVGTIKDKASQVTSRQSVLPVLRATTHDPRAAPSQKRIAAVLALGGSSRAAASGAVEALMDRLSRTRDAYVALKCLMAAHHVAASGGFILRDQLAAVPAAGGRNYLNLSTFRDSSSHVAWELSGWVRWYAHYVETLVSLSRAVGYFLGDHHHHQSCVSGVTNCELVREMDALVGLAHQIAKQPQPPEEPSQVLVEEIKVMVGRDCKEAMGEIRIRVIEFRERLSCLSFAHSVELVCQINRLLSFRGNLGFHDSEFWSLIDESKHKSSSLSFSNNSSIEKKLIRKNDFWTESARFPDRVLRAVDSLQFGSGRLSVSAF